MPTIILVDNSLSVVAPAFTKDDGTVVSHRDVQHELLSAILDDIISSCRMEYIALVVYSSRCDNVVSFTRDLEALKKGVGEVGDTTRLATGLQRAAELMRAEYGHKGHPKLVILTDGRSEYFPPAQEDSQSLPFVVSVIITSPSSDDLIERNLPSFDRLVQSGLPGGNVYSEAAVSEASIATLSSAMTSECYKPCTRQVKFGHLNFKVQVFPTLKSWPEGEGEDSENRMEVADPVVICGFLPVAEVANAPITSRHILLPLTEGEGDVTHTPSFHMLLHGGLKIESNVALVQIEEAWFGIIHTMPDSKKKNALILSIFYPGCHEVAWLGNLSHLALPQDFDENPYGEHDPKAPFPVPCPTQKSYSPGGSGALWIQQTTLQSDIQKVIRNAKKLPDKQQAFNRELNRLRRMSLAMGCSREVLPVLASFLEREAANYDNKALGRMLTQVTTWLRSSAAHNPRQMPPPIA